MPQIITANRLIDGAVVFRTETGGWDLAVDSAGILGDKTAADAAHVAALADPAVVDVALIDVTMTDGRVVPTRLRERIRAFGPTVKSDHRADLHPIAS